MYNLYKTKKLKRNKKIIILRKNKKRFNVLMMKPLDETILDGKIEDKFVKNNK